MFGGGAVQCAEKGASGMGRGVKRVVEAEKGREKERVEK
ncbi:hypothetical protein T4B_10071 [Trichinella pseudospiralis]|uniref:Uncharacterized protein n=1 Tax=Trichinella pseudospiralis TaxID=6337 RepID=A0A0V1GAA1_TRIPS|nr:hypothetical protein T4B_10071 [Trichinella pseudospiralis]